jgi:hypothetical protein
MNLADWLKKSHPPSEQVNVVEAVCEALHKAHAAGELRGEIGPAGLDVAGDRCDLSAIPTPVPPSYRAPESRGGGASGPAAAVFSAGVLLYEILAGRSPFPSGATTDQAEPLRNVRRDLPSELTDAVMACLESDPDWRPKDLSYVLQVLKRLRGNAPAAAAPAPAPARSASRPAQAESRARPEPARARKAQPAAKSAKGAKSGGPPLLAIAIGASVLIAGGVFYWLSMPRGQKPVAALPSGTATPAQTQPATAASATPAGGATTPAVIAATATMPALAATPLPAATPAPTQTPLPPLSTPTPARVAPTPVAVAQATPLPTAPPTAPPTPYPTAPPTPAPTLAPVATQTATATAAASAALATLKSVAPPMMPRGSTNFYDLHGTGMQAGLNAVIMRGRDVATGVVVTKQAIVNPSLMRVVVRVDAAVAPGAYSLILVDSRGQATNAVPLKVP